MNQFGIKYTAEQFTETELLKIQNDAAAPHFLYQEILSWASEAKRNKYSFCPQHIEHSSQVRYLEKWLHLIKACSSRNSETSFTWSCHASNSSYLVQLYQPTACLSYYLILR
jgi:hypothetical protein